MVRNRESIGTATPLTVFAISDKRPDFIALQVRALRRFVVDPYRFVILNNGESPELRQAIDTAAHQSHLEVMPLPHHAAGNASDICAAAMQFVHDQLLPVIRGIVAIVDSDMVPIQEFSIASFLGEYHVAGVEQNRGHVIYMWNGLVFLNCDTLPNSSLVDWSCGQIDGHAVDTGGQLYHWIRHTPGLRWRRIHMSGRISSEHGNLGLLPSEFHAEYRDGFDFELLEGAFLHYCRGSGWANESDEYHRNKTALFTQIVEESVADRVTWLSPSTHVADSPFFEP